ncbi:MAG: 4Fe-4S binding protein [Dehalococcoidales bacterium]|nr:4Fe-4S binding protein [Dehalococcoidales bacterium]
MDSNLKQTARQVIVLAERCKQCGFCIEFCPKHILSESEDINSHGYHTVKVKDGGECSGCNICSMVCPDFAIYVVSGGEKAK